VLIFEHRRLLQHKGEIATDARPVALGIADVVRSGEHVTVVAAQLMRHRALEAAERLAADGISAEVIDPRSLVPFDLDTVVASLEKTNRLVVVQEAPPGGSWGATLVARICGEQFELLDAPPELVACDETPVPYAEELEEAWMPSVDDIEQAIRRALAF
jgi:pyruvate dehydrogenase E1 component beta subunit